jgi:hypothetical protein
MAKNSFDPVGTLSIGNVVTTGTILYRSNFKRYLQVSLRATAWLVAIVVATFGLTAIGSLLFGITKSWLVTIPVILVWIGLTLYLLAKYATDRAVICRLAYQELIDTPETIGVATGHLRPRTWGFLRLSLLLGLYMFLIFMISYIALILIAVVAGGLLSVLKFVPNVFTSVIIGILAIGLVLLWIALLIRYYAAWFVSELPLAIESTTSANFSLRRSRQLSTTTIRKLVLIITVAFMITLPINIIGSIPSVVGQTMIRSSTPFALDSGEFLVFIGSILSIAIELFVMPFWQTIKAIVYYDLRNRREGGDLII